MKDEKIKTAMSGLPGNMASLIAINIINSEDMELDDFALTEPNEMKSFQFWNIPKEAKTDKSAVSLEAKSLGHENLLNIFSKRKIIVVDFTNPDTVNRNAELYTKHGVPFVMGTTGGKREKLVETVKSSQISAVIAPNMGIPLVLVQAMLEYAASTFSGALKGYTLEITESHQKTKKDTSGTAKTFKVYFNDLGAIMRGDIVSIRDRNIQKLQLKIQNLDGHGYHWYKLKNEKAGVEIELSTRVEGRDVYARDTLHAIRFLYKKINEGSKGEVFTMIDVLKSLKQQ